MDDFAFSTPSIYQILYDNLDEQGRLPRDFSLQGALGAGTAGQGFFFSDGFMEANVTGSDKGEDPCPELISVVQQILDGQYGEAVRNLKAYFAPEEEHLMNQVVLPLQHWIYDHRDTVDPERLIWFAGHLLQEADQVEIVKFGLTLLEFYDFGDDEEFPTMLHLLAQCNEFTLFCLRDFSVWDTALSEIFQVAQNVYGWGRIFALEVLEPKTAQIRQWMLEEGWDNDVNPEYTALLIAQSVDLTGVVGRPALTAKAFYGAGRILDALLQDEPAPGISEIKEPVKLFKGYLDHAKTMAKTVEDYEIILHVLQYVETHVEGVNQEALKQQCGAILTSFACAQTVREALEQGKGFALARALELPYSEAAEKVLREAPLDRISLLPYALTNDEAHNREVIHVYEEALPLGTLLGGDWEEMPVRQQLSKEYLDLNAVISQLYGYPGVGRNLILAALTSPASMNRNTALEVLLQWHHLGYQLTDALRHQLEHLCLREKDSDILEKAHHLLGGHGCCELQ